MNNIISADNGIVTQGQTQDGKFYVKTTYLDDAILKANHTLKNSNTLNNMKFNLHDGEDVRGIIRCPSTDQWVLFKQANPGIIENLNSKNEYERLNALKQISLLEPEWVLMARH